MALAEPDQRVGLLDPRPGGAAHAIGVEEHEDDVERAVAAGAAQCAAHPSSQSIGQCHEASVPIMSRSGRS